MFNTLDFRVCVAQKAAFRSVPVVAALTVFWEAVATPQAQNRDISAVCLSLLAADLFFSHYRLNPCNSRFFFTECPCMGWQQKRAGGNKSALIHDRCKKKLASYHGILAAN